MLWLDLPSPDSETGTFLDRGRRSFVSPRRTTTSYKVLMPRRSVCQSTKKSGYHSGYKRMLIATGCGTVDLWLLALTAERTLFSWTIHRCQASYRWLRRRIQTGWFCSAVTSRSAPTSWLKWEVRLGVFGTIYGMISSMQICSSVIRSRASCQTWYQQKWLVTCLQLQIGQ